MQMTSTMSVPVRAETASPWEPGVYLTDGARLLCVVSCEGTHVYLEDASTECLERRHVCEVVQSMSQIAPCSSP
jgi:hypothetical protein